MASLYRSSKYVNGMRLDATILSIYMFLFIYSIHLHVYYNDIKTLIKVQFKL